MRRYANSHWTLWRRRKGEAAPHAYTRSTWDAAIDGFGAAIPQFRARRGRPRACPSGRPRPVARRLWPSRTKFPKLITC